jgi:plastocyanin
MNKTIVIILIIVVIVGGFYLLFGRNNTPAPESQGASPNTTNEISPQAQVNGTPVAPGAQMETGTVNENNVTVTYIDTGFSPKTVTIKKGGTVTFVNQSSGGMWVASNPHPTHTDYPAFDEKATVTKGGSWSFTFDRVGSWGYHNHQNSSNTGTVVVE